MTLAEHFENNFEEFVDYLINEKNLCITTPYDYAVNLIETVELDPTSIFDLKHEIYNIHSEDKYVFESNYDSPFSFSTFSDFCEMIDRDYCSYELDTSDFDKEYNNKEQIKIWNTKNKSYEDDWER